MKYRYTLHYSAGRIDLTDRKTNSVYDLRNADDDTLSKVSQNVATSRGTVEEFRRAA
jgi:hypothetical protein